ncbi:hypothetical protein FRC09_013430 [Ceratobasidium sp. 395]|nr:hypothetical protein FRC09_013430 [Ceratobasidium sp. 395]
MSVQEMFQCLLYNGCIDLSSHLDTEGQSSVAIAGGGFGDIYRGRLRDGTSVAIKALRHHLLAQDTSRKALKRAMRELYVWSKTKHENVQELVGIVIFQERLGMVSPWMDNGNLEEYIRKNSSVDRYELCLQVARGVSYLHDINMVHGDLKAAPELLLSSDEGEDEDEDEVSAPRTSQTDIYALGMTLLEIVTGKVPYAEYKVDRAIIRALDKKQFPKCPKEFMFEDGPENWMWLLLQTCWDHDPKARPPASFIYSRLTAESSPFTWRTLWQYGFDMDIEPISP